MENILSKYNQLSPENQKEVNDFLDFMLSKKDSQNSFNITSWKARILDVSVWSEDDIKVFEDNKKHFNQWRNMYL